MVGRFTMSHWKRVQKTINTGRKDQATMVFGSYIKVRKQIRQALKPTDVFAMACELASVKMTRRQQNKYNRGVGAAFAKRGEASAALTTETGVTLS